MSALFIDEKAVEVIRSELEKEHKRAVRIFMAGGGCCGRLEIMPVEKALSGDVIYHESDFTIFIEKYLEDYFSSINVRYDEKRGLMIQLN